MIAFFVWMAVQPGFAERSRPVTPATNGDAIEEDDQDV
jgi:hypothetical protein